MTTNNKSGKSSVTEGFRGNGVHTPTFKKSVPMPLIKPAPNTPTTNPPKNKQ